MRAKTPNPSKARGGGRRRRRGAPTPVTSPAMAGSSPAGDLSAQLGHVSLLPLPSAPEASTLFQKLLGAPSDVPPLLTEGDDAALLEDKDYCILSQDFFCTPDYITPDAQPISNNFELNKENISCPKSPEKSVVARSKRYKRDCSPSNPRLIAEVQLDIPGSELVEQKKLLQIGSQKKKSYVSQSAVALRCRVMPPPCIKNPYLNSVSAIDVDIFCSSPSVGCESLSRYRTDFHEIEQIGCGNFSRVFKVLKRIDGCLYAVKHSIKQLRNDLDRKRALMEVQALAALGSHDNVVRYYTSWFENEQLYIQIELCERSLSINRSHAPKCGEVLEMLYQIAKALHFMHKHGVAHLDVKPENIYIKKGIYKLGDFGCATLIDRSLGIEEGDSRYMPQEMLNDKYEHLDKVDIFSLGAATYELVKGTPLAESGPQFSNLREGKISLLPGYPLQFQSLLKAMMDPDPLKRPSAKEVMEHPIFDKLRTNL
ncbi:Wee1-like protein kinase [Ananas comosus]|uniref:Wee1-like protein kinase n=1 Tax=Ananas comosus TaxID=4615 RepID=A0A199V4H2_ANACO|nr:Wee1-like protein kinase [Ananas comosus]